jgi:hypothetical protein
VSGPDCVWCGMTIDAHREQGPAAKTPCGMLKRGFKPITQTSVGDVPAPMKTIEQAMAEEIVDAIISDLKSRKGFDAMWDDLDVSIVNELRDRWIGIARMHET